MHGIVAAYTLEEGINNADLVAQITITDMVKELEGPIYQTIYSAKVNEVYMSKVDLMDSTINILQMGNSTIRFNDNEPFQRDETYILLLMQARGESADYINTYYILGEETSFYKVSEHLVTNSFWKDRTLEAIIKDTASVNEREQVTYDKEQFILKLKDLVKQQKSINEFTQNHLQN